MSDTITSSDTSPKTRRNTHTIQTQHVPKLKPPPTLLLRSRAKTSELLTWRTCTERNAYFSEYGQNVECKSCMQRRNKNAGNKRAGKCTFVKALNVKVASICMISCQARHISHGSRHLIEATIKQATTSNNQDCVTIQARHISHGSRHLIEATIKQATTSNNQDCVTINI